MFGSRLLSWLGKPSHIAAASELHGDSKYDTIRKAHHLPPLEYSIGTPDFDPVPGSVGKNLVSWNGVESNSCLLNMIDNIKLFLRGMMHTDKNLRATERGEMDGDQHLIRPQVEYIRNPGSENLVCCIKEPSDRHILLHLEIEMHRPEKTESSRPKRERERPIW